MGNRITDYTIFNMADKLKIIGNAQVYILAKK